ncbi:hypothetical protein T4A_3374 [Trichinella pseudospiralis]|uniref:Uncharacterized protein n=1 Tax=Trichinella pseudospiralis TaxID=6337 RepID=A0A0V1EFT0_TRIPS|nr:hypothetical protein T4A_3374 [Trichinella pseudospiralis]
MLKRETIIDRRPTTTTVIIFESEQNIVCLKALCECELSTIGAVEKGGHRTNTSTSNDNDDTMTTGHHQPPLMYTVMKLRGKSARNAGLFVALNNDISSFHKTIQYQEHTNTHTGKAQSRGQILEPCSNACLLEPNVKVKKNSGLNNPKLNPVITVARHHCCHMIQIHIFISNIYALLLEKMCRNQRGGSFFHICLNLKTETNLQSNKSLKREKVKV